MKRNFAKICDLPLKIPPRPVFSSALVFQIRIEKSIVHEGYSPRNSYANDIALLRLAELAMLNLGTGVACLPIPVRNITSIFLLE